MKYVLSVAVLAIMLPLSNRGQEPTLVTDSVTLSQSSETQERPAELATSIPGSSDTAVNRSAVGPPAAKSRFGYYMTETWLNPSTFTAPAFRASIRMANPPGKGPDRYPNEWRQGAQGFGRNYGEAFAARISTHTAQFVTGTLTREDPNYMPSTSRHFLIRSSHALLFTFVGRSDSGRCMPAFSNFAGAAAGGFVGNAYLPDGFRDSTHAGQRAVFQFGMLSGGNLFREFAPQMPVPIRAFISLIAR